MSQNFEYQNRVINYIMHILDVFCNTAKFLNLLCTSCLIGMMTVRETGVAGNKSGE